MVQPFAGSNKKVGWSRVTTTQYTANNIAYLDPWTGSDPPPVLANPHLALLAPFPAAFFPA